jgi:hypothetical protein
VTTRGILSRGVLTVSPYWYIKEDPTLPYQALVIRESAKLSEGQRPDLFSGFVASSLRRVHNRSSAGARTLIRRARAEIRVQFRRFINVPSRERTRWHLKCWPEPAKVAATDAVYLEIVDVRGKQHRYLIAKLPQASS